MFIHSIHECKNADNHYVKLAAIIEADKITLSYIEQVVMGMDENNVSLTFKAPRLPKDATIVAEWFTYVWERFRPFVQESPSILDKFAAGVFRNIEAEL